MYAHDRHKLDSEEEKAVAQNQESHVYVDAIQLDLVMSRTSVSGDVHSVKSGNSVSKSGSGRV